MRNYITVSTVSFHAVWGNKSINLKRIAEYAESLSKQGSNIIVFPEMALTGYEYDEDYAMQVELAEGVDGPAVATISEITKKYKTYVVFGMAESDMDGKVYNSAAVCGPKGFVGMYRKIHLPLNEPRWASSGENPFLFETEWGPVGITICYDTYLFPEIMRYYKAKGARLLLNPTAVFRKDKTKAHMTSLFCYAATNNIYIASANLYGVDHKNVFIGKSNIIGPAKTNGEALLLAGEAFDEEKEGSETVETASFDMSILPYHTYSHLFDKNVKVGTPDWRPELYLKMCMDLLQEEKWKRGEG